MAAFWSRFADFRSAVILLFFYLGCMFLSSVAHPHGLEPKRRKVSPVSFHNPHVSFGPRNLRNSVFSSLGSRVRQLFTFSRVGSPAQPQEQQTETLTSTLVPFQRRLHLHVNDDGNSEDRNPLATFHSSESPAPRAPTGAISNAVYAEDSSFAYRDDVFPCVACGEVFNKIRLLDLHQASRHAFSELADGDSGKNIVKIIFQSGWKGRGSWSGLAGIPAVHRVLKIHNSAKTITRFEEYRESVRSRAADRWAVGHGGGGEERCVADGNERLRFYCATFLCGLGRDGNVSTCGSPFCTACEIVRHGFSGKDADGVATHGTGWGAHASLPEDLEREFQFMRIRRAILVCRVVAGRVALGKRDAFISTEGEGYDSAVEAGRAGDACTEEDVLLVFDPRAVLPCFLIIYSV